MPTDFRPTQGEFRGDFSRDTFDPSKHFLRVLMQQGRVQLDADWNEQAAILLHYLQALARDLIGEHGGPDRGFEITDAGTDFQISPGHYYVNGLLCENEAGRSYMDQPDYPFPTELQGDSSYLVYLDVWERHITHLEDRDIKEGSIREIALGGADTATRSKVVWQVKVEPLLGSKTEAAASDFLKGLSERRRPTLRAQAYVSQTPTDPCTIQPEMRYRGSGNQLYRVEIHTGADLAGEKPTFKWSRDNGSVVLPILAVIESTVSVAHLGKDDRFSLKKGDWVEIVDDDYVLENRADPLLQVHAVDRDQCRITLQQAPKGNVGTNPTKHPLVRRWDHASPKTPQVEGKPKRAEDGALLVQERRWLTLENGVQVQFPSAQPPYRTGDFWLIPARVATGDVEWPRNGNGSPRSLPPHGINHHYAPLRLISTGQSGEITLGEPLRRTLKILTE